MIGAKSVSPFLFFSFGTNGPQANLDPIFVFKHDSISFSSCNNVKTLEEKVLMCVKLREKGCATFETKFKNQFIFTEDRHFTRFAG